MYLFHSVTVHNNEETLNYRVAGVSDRTEDGNG